MKHTTLYGNAHSDIRFGKVVSSPTLFSWSNVYNAGKLFAVLSLEKTNDQELSDTSSDSLNILGKTLLSKLEEEFFTLDSKDLSSIKQAILNTFKDVKETIKYSFAASFFSNDNLYIFVIGNAAVFIKRESRIAKFETPVQQHPKSIVSFVGKTINNDLIVITTDSSLDILKEDVFLKDNAPNEIVEFLTPTILEKEDGKISLIILKYVDQKPLAQETEQPQEIEESKKEEPKAHPSFIANLRKYMPSKRINFNLIRMQLNHSKKVSLTIAIIVAAIFVSSIYFAVEKQEKERLQVFFEDTYPDAEKKYNEGNSLLGLNRNVARKNFLESKKILQEAKNRFPKNSKEEKHFNDLLQKVEDGIKASSGINLVDAKEIDAKESIFLSLQTKKQAQFAKDSTNVYFANADSINSVSEKDGKEKEIIKNSDSWKDATALGVYFGNIYLLDKSQNQILKFVPIQNGYGKSNYLTSSISPSFANAVSIAIDGSIFILSKDGTIQKFTRGKPDQFTVSELDAPLSSPSKIFTDRNASNIYILDNGNSRIVALNKEGIYQNQYQTEVLKNARDFEVLEKKKKIFVLSQNKVYEIEIK